MPGAHMRCALAGGDVHVVAVLRAASKKAKKQ
jgi:hypothetical protein